MYIFIEFFDRNIYVEMIFQNLLKAVLLTHIKILGVANANTIQMNNLSDYL